VVFDRQTEMAREIVRRTANGDDRTALFDERAKQRNRPVRRDAAKLEDALRTAVAMVAQQARRS